MTDVSESWRFEPRREYEAAGTLVTTVQQQDREGFVCEVEERTAVYLDVETGLLVGNRERFEIFMEPLDHAVREAEWERDNDD